jgi:hypothetical protein
VCIYILRRRVSHRWKASDYLIPQQTSKIAVHSMAGTTQLSNHVQGGWWWPCSCCTNLSCGCSAVCCCVLCFVCYCSSLLACIIRLRWKKSGLIIGRRLLVPIPNSPESINNCRPGHLVFYMSHTPSQSLSPPTHPTLLQRFSLCI